VAEAARTTSSSRRQRRLLRVIFDASASRVRAPSPDIKMIDDMIAVDERDQNLAKPPREWEIGDVGMGARLRFLNPHQAQYGYLCAFQRFVGKL
jgi:hypothetical protein